MLAPREGPPRHLAIDVHREGGVAAGPALDPRPLRRGDDLARLDPHLLERDPVVLAVGREVGELGARALLELPEALDGETAVRRPGQAEDRLGDVLGGVQPRAPVADTAAHGSVAALELLDLLRGLPGDALPGDAGVLDERPERGHLVVDDAVVALDDDELGHRLAGNRLALPGLPVAHDPAGLCQLLGRVVEQRRGDEVAAHAEVLLREFLEALGDRREGVPVAARLPRRRDRLVERVHERVEVRAGDVVLLVPGRGGQDDVRVQRRPVHAEVDRREEVELPGGRLLAPVDLGRALVGAGLLRGYRRLVDAEQVLEEVLMPLRGRAEQVRPPERQHAREVRRVVGVLGREAQAPGLQLVDGVLRRLLARGGGLVAEVERVAVERRVAREPAHAGRLDDGVGEVLALQRAGPEGAGQLVDAEALVAPLVGRQVPERRGRLLAWRAGPVGRERGDAEPGDRPHLLLPDVVRPAAAVDPLAPAQEQHAEHAAVDLVAVEPVVRAGPHDDHRPALGDLRVAGELARDPRHQAAVDVRVLLLPGGRPGLGIVVTGGPVAGQAVASDAELRAEQVEHGGHEPVADPLGGNAAAHDAAALGLADVETRQVELDELVVGAEQREPRSDVAELEVPVAGALLAPAVADGAVGHGELAGGVVEDDGLPLGVLGRLADVGGAEEAVGDVRAVALAQGDEERQVRVLLGVPVEVRRLLLDVVLLEDHVRHAERERPVRAGLGVHPVVGELRVAGVVRRHDDDLLPPIAGLRHEVRVRRAGLRDVRAPEDHVARVPPVGGLGDVRLVAPHLR